MGCEGQPWAEFSCSNVARYVGGLVGRVGVSDLENSLCLGGPHGCAPPDGCEPFGWWRVGTTSWLVGALPGGASEFAVGR